MIFICTVTIIWVQVNVHMRTIPTGTVGVLSYIGCSNYNSNFSDASSGQFKFRENAGKHLSLEHLHLPHISCQSPAHTYLPAPALLPPNNDIYPHFEFFRAIGKEIIGHTTGPAI